MSIVTTDGGLTAFGYGLSILAAALFFFIAGMISRNQKTKISARQLVFCGTAIALAYLTSYIRLIPKMPYGGSVTLFSMLFICHDLALVQLFCDRVIVMHDGHVEEEGTPEEIIEHPKTEYTEQLIRSVL